MKLISQPVFAGEDGGAGAATQAGGAGSDTMAGGGADTQAGGGADTQAAGGADKSLMNREPGDKQTAGAADWPADWREKLAGGDAKRLEELKRVTDPTTLGKRFFDAQDKIRSGKINADEPMPDPEKDAAGAKAWREARGIPEKPDGYALDPKVDKRLTDEDKAVFGTLRDVAHKAGLPASAVSTFGAWYADTVEAQRQVQAEQDAAAAEKAEDILRKELGNEYKPMHTIAQRYAQEVLGKDAANVFDARLPDGRRLGDVPEFIKGFIKLGVAEYGDVSFAGGEAKAHTEDRIAEIEKLMKTDFSKYEADTAMRAEYQDLLEKRDKANAAKAGAR